AVPSLPAAAPPAPRPAVLPGVPRRAGAGGRGATCRLGVRGGVASPHSAARLRPPPKGSRRPRARKVAGMSTWPPDHEFEHRIAARLLDVLIRAALIGLLA